MRGEKNNHCNSKAIIKSVLKRSIIHMLREDKISIKIRGSRKREKLRNKSNAMNRK